MGRLAFLLPFSGVTMKRASLALCLSLLLGAAVAAAANGQDPAAGGCPPQGDATKPKQQQLNQLKARTEEPSDDDVDDTADISALIAPGDDTLRWQSDTAVEVTAFVVDVRDAGMASSNCHSSDPADHDTILDLSPGANVSDASHRMVAVITPQWRRLMAGNRVDWSTRAIRAKYTQQYVTIRGWLLFNTEAAGRSLNSTSLPGANITRATAWEIHPVTSIKLNTDSFELQSRLARPPAPQSRSNASNSAR